MKKLQRISFHLHWITLCCFLLPFFYDSCSNKKTEDEESRCDTCIVAASNNMEDSITHQSHPLDTANAIPNDTITEGSKNNEDEFSSRKIIKKYPFLGPVLIPNTNTFTGLGTVVNTIPFISLFASSITFLLLLIGFLSKIIDKNALKTFLIIETCATTFLLVARPYMIFDYEILWGYWISIVCISTLTIIDAYIIYKIKRIQSNKKKPSCINIQEG